MGVVESRARRGPRDGGSALGASTFPVQPARRRHHLPELSSTRCLGQREHAGRTPDPAGPGLACQRVAEPSRRGGRERSPGRGLESRSRPAAAQLSEARAAPAKPSGAAGGGSPGAAGRTRRGGRGGGGGGDESRRGRPARPADRPRRALLLGGGRGAKFLGKPTHCVPNGSYLPKPVKEEKSPFFPQLTADSRRKGME